MGSAGNAFSLCLSDGQSFGSVYREVLEATYIRTNCRATTGRVQKVDG